MTVFMGRGLELKGNVLACMEVNKDLISSLIERAWGLHGRLNCEIEKCVDFCRFCSENGRFCDIPDQTPFEERKRLIAIRDSVKHVENILSSLQKLQSWQLRERQEALARLEESRLVLIELVKNYKGRPPDVLRELNACFGNEKAITNTNQQKKWPLSFCGIIKKLFFIIKWKWQRPVGFAVKFLVLTTSISSFVHLNQTRNLSSRSRRKVPSFLDSTEAEMRDGLLNISRSPINVFHGRG